MPSFWFMSPSLLIWFIIKASQLVSLIFWKCTSTHNTSLLNNFLWLICPNGWRKFLPALVLRYVPCLTFCRSPIGAPCSCHIVGTSNTVCCLCPVLKFKIFQEHQSEWSPWPLPTNALGHSAECQIWLQFPAPWPWLSSWGTSADPSQGPQKTSL